MLVHVSVHKDKSAVQAGPSRHKRLQKRGCCAAHTRCTAPDIQENVSCMNLTFSARNFVRSARVEGTDRAV